MVKQAYGEKPPDATPGFPPKGRPPQILPLELPEHSKDRRGLEEIKKRITFEEAARLNKPSRHPRDCPTMPTLMEIQYISNLCVLRIFTRRTSS